MHVIILPIAFLLSLYADNIDHLSLDVLLFPLLIALLSAVAVVGFLRVCRQQVFIKSTLTISLWVSLGMSYGIVFKALGKGDLGFVIGGLTVGTNTMLVPLWTLAFALGTYCIVRSQGGLRQAQTLANIVALALLIVPVTRIIAYEIPRAQRGRLTIGRKGEEAIKLSTERREQRPDIYYLIFDRYASNRVLRNIYGFDNEQFVKALKGRGFYVASESTANYPKTAHSLASSLNMEYLDALTTQIGPDSSDWTPLFELLRDYRVWRFLKARSYRFIHFGSWWEPTSQNEFADLNVNFGFRRDFENALLRSSVVYPIFRKLYGYDWKREQSERVLYKFDMLANIPRRDPPKFVFAHFLLPHRPYVFGPSGRFVVEENKNGREAYLGQLRFSNKKIIELVDKIIDRSTETPIIILQSDEGPFPLRYQRDVAGFDWREATTEELQEKMQILNAYYVPAELKKLLYESISPVNSFRVILNWYFDATYPMLEDEAFAFVNEERLYQFFKVTERLR